MKTKTLMIGLVLIAVLAPLALAAPEDAPRGPRPEGGPAGGWQRGGEGPAMGGPGMGFGGGDFAAGLLGRMGERLGLTEEQKTQIKAIVDANKDKVQASREAVRDAMTALNEAADAGDEAAIKAAGKTLGEAFTEQAIQRAKTIKQVKALLTEEQLAEFEKARAEMKERMQQRRQAGEAAGPGEGPRGQRGPRRNAPQTETED